MPAVGASILGFMNTQGPKKRRADKVGRIALHVLAAIVLYLALTTVLWLGLQVSPVWGTAGFIGWIALVAAYVRWARRRGRGRRG